MAQEKGKEIEYKFDYFSYGSYNTTQYKNFPLISRNYILQCCYDYSNYSYGNYSSWIVASPFYNSYSVNTQISYGTTIKFFAHFDDKYTIEYAVMEGILIRTLNGQLLQSITDDKFQNPETIKFSQNGEFFVIYRNVSSFENKIYSYLQMNNRTNTSNIEEFQNIKTMNIIKIKCLICLDLRFIKLFV